MSDDLLKGIISVIDPSIRQRFGPLVSGATQLFRTTPYTPTATKDLLTSTANISRGGVLPIIDATGRFLTTGVTQALEANPAFRPVVKGAKFASNLAQEAIESVTKKSTDEKIVDLINKIGSKKAAKAEEILKDLDDEALMLTRPDDIMNILNEGGLEGTISPNVAKNIKNLIKKKRGIDTRFFNIDFSTEKGTQAKKIFDDVYGGVITKGEGAIKLQELYPTAKLGFVDIGAMKKKKKPTVTPRFGEVFEDYINKFREGKQPTAEGKVYKAGRFYSDLGPTYNTILKDSTKRNKYDTPKFYKVYDQLDDKNKIVVENFLESALPFFAKGESRSGPMMKMRELIARMYKSKSREGISDEELFKQLNDVDMGALVNVLKQNQVLINKIKDANAQGINLSTFNLSHIADVSNNWKNTLDANNLYFLETKLNLSDSRQANKQITELLEQAKKAKTKGEKDRVLEKINALGEVLESKNLITKVDGQTFGAKNVDSKSSFERIKKNLEKEYSQKDVGVVDYAGGGLATMAHMTRPLDGTR